MKLLTVIGARLAEFDLTPPNHLHVVEPVGYLEMIWLEANCRCVATDSGGMQKEAYFFGKQCITLRDETEWVELVESGGNTIVGVDPYRISDAISVDGGQRARPNLYGNGNASQLIIESIYL